MYHFIKCLIKHKKIFCFLVVTKNSYYLTEILSQLKWLPDLVDGQSLAVEILEILQHAPHKAQDEMIRLVPEIIPQNYHRLIGESLL